MRLQTKINIRFLLVILMLFAVAGVIFYFVLGRVIDQNISEMIRSRMTNVNLYLQQSKVANKIIESPDRTISIRKIASAENFHLISDTLAFDEDEQQLITFRKMVYTTTVDGQNYEVTILQSLLESEDLQTVIFYFMIVLFSLSLVSLFFLNRWLSEKAWKPFLKSLMKLKSWKLGENHQISFEPTHISEFDQLNQILEEMVRKMQIDYINLKEFTENASHEIQTPLAIVKSKLELLLNDNTLTDLQNSRLHDAFETVIRLSKLNEALLLLSKIENQQFIEKRELELCGLIRSRAEFLEELFELKQIELSLQLDTPFTVFIHPMLADILINNLLSNALKHNFSQGKIIITSKVNEITFSNTGSETGVEPTKLFNRFVKNSNSEESTGLGLAIADEICKFNQLKLDYTYSNGLHCFKLSKGI